MDERREELSMEEVLNSVGEIRGRVGELVKGVVVNKMEDGLMVDFQGKAEGIVPTKELVKPLEEYSLGDELELQITRIDDEEGRIILSERRPKFRDALRKLQDALSNGSAVVKGKIKNRIKGGYSVILFDVLEAFLPGSQSLIRSSEPIPEGELEFEVINFENRGRRPNIVLSRRSLRERKIEEFFNKVEVGDVIEGIVESVQPFGVFVNLTEGLSGLLPKSEVGYTPVADLRDMFEKGQKVKLKIINLEPQQRKITLSLKALLPDPWEEFVKDHDVGDVVSGTVSSIKPFGFFVKLAEGVEGLVPLEEIFWSRRRGNIRNIVKPGDVVDVEIIEVDREKRRILLSYKKAKGDPWEKVDEKYPVGSEATGVVVSVIPTGAIVELEDGVAGFVPKGELSWNYFEKPEEVVRPRRRTKVKILDVDKSKKRMRLSIKRAQKNPWDRVKGELSRGSVVQGKVRRIIGSGAIVHIPKYGVDALLPNGHFEDVKEGDRIEAVVLRIISDENRPRMIISVKELEEFRALEEYKKSVQSEIPSKKLGDILKKGEKNG